MGINSEFLDVGFEYTCPWCGYVDRASVNINGDGSISFATYCGTPEHNRKTVDGKDCMVIPRSTAQVYRHYVETGKMTEAEYDEHFKPKGCGKMASFRGKWTYEINTIEKFGE